MEGHPHLPVPRQGTPSLHTVRDYAGIKLLDFSGRYTTGRRTVIHHQVMRLITRIGELNNKPVARRHCQPCRGKGHPVSPYTEFDSCGFPGRCNCCSMLTLSLQPLQPLRQRRAAGSSVLVSRCKRRMHPDYQTAYQKYRCRTQYRPSGYCEKGTAGPGIVRYI